MNQEPIIESNGNVFADIGLEDAEAWRCKAQLAAEILAAIQRRHWTQQAAAAYLGISQAEISNIKRGQFDRFTFDRLLSYLCKLERDIRIQVTRRSDHQHGHLAVQCQ